MLAITADTSLLRRAKKNNSTKHKIAGSKKRSNMNLNAENKGCMAETKTNRRPMEKRKHSEIGTDAAAVSSGAMSGEQSPAAPMHEDVHQQPLLSGIEPLSEPLKVCLDDDSSIEDGDEDMFDDDAFYFGDEDFAALMSHESMKRPRRSTAPASAALASQSSLHPPLHHSASMFNEHLGIGSVTASSSATALSSTGKFA